MPKRKYVVYLKNTDRQIVITDDENDERSIDDINETLSNYMSGVKNFSLSNNTDKIIINPFSVSAIHVQTVEGSEEDTIVDNVDIDIEDEIIVEEDEEEETPKNKKKKSKSKKGSIKAKKNEDESFNIEKLIDMGDDLDTDNENEQEETEEIEEAFDTELEENIEDAENEEEDLDEVKSWHSMVEEEDD